MSYPDIEWKYGVIPTGKRIAVDTETTGLNPYQGDKAFLFSFANEAGEVSVVPRELEYHAMLEKFFADESITKVFHNAKFDIKMIREAGFEVKGSIADTIVMAKLADENEVSYRLKYLCGKYFDYSAVEDERMDNFKKKNKVESYEEIPEKILHPYAAVDAWNCMLLFHMYLPVAKDFKEMYMMDMQCLKYLIEIEDRGVLIDKKLAKKLAQDLKKENLARQKEMKKITGIKLEPDNNRLLGYAIWDWGGEIFERTDPSKLHPRGQPKLDKDILPKYVDSIPWMATFIEFKKTKAVINSLSNQIIDNLDASNCVHTSFNLSQARTGRFSSSQPNLQNINKTSCVREIFVPRKGYTFFYFDYSQIEYRLFAYLSGDEKLLEGYRSGEMDMHDDTASNLRISRDAAKTVNFLMLYGGGVKGLSKKLGIGKGEAAEMLEMFRATTPSLGALKDKLLLEWDKNDCIEDPFGKKYHIKRGDENKIVNTLIQGCACNVLKYTMLSVRDLIEGEDTYMIQQIHDENIFEVNNKDMGMIPLIKSCMERVPQIEIPLVVDVEWSKTNWAEKTKYPMDELKKWTMNE